MTQSIKKNLFYTQIHQDKVCIHIRHNGTFAFHLIFLESKYSCNISSSYLTFNLVKMMGHCALYDQFLKSCNYLGIKTIFLGNSAGKVFVKDLGRKVTRRKILFTIHLVLLQIFNLLFINYVQKC